MRGGLRRTAMKGPLLAALAALALAGCLQAATTAPPTATQPSPCADLPCALAHAPHVDARATLDDLKAFSSAYPYRQGLSPTHAQAADDLAGRFAAAGLEVVRENFTYQGTTTAGGGVPQYPAQNVIGVKWGSDRTHFIVVGAHYDVTEGAVYGTYDDGSGTALVFKLAQAFAKVNTTRTILFCEFDQEERGLIGSAHFLNQTESGKFPHPGVVDGMVDLDMIGITWPHPAHMIVWQDSPSLRERIAGLAAAAKMPADHLEFRKPLGGSSDGATFIRAGIPTAYFWSDWDAYVLPGGGVAPATPVPYVGPYPWWHKLDTYDTMVASAGDEATLQAGFQTTLDIVSPLLLAMTQPGFALDYQK